MSPVDLPTYLTSTTLAVPLPPNPSSTEVHLAISYLLARVKSELKIARWQSNVRLDSYTERIDQYSRDLERFPIAEAEVEFKLRPYHDYLRREIARMGVAGWQTRVEEFTRDYLQEQFPAVAPSPPIEYYRPLNGNAVVEMVLPSGSSIDQKLNEQKLVSEAVDRDIQLRKEDEAWSFRMTAREAMLAYNAGFRPQHNVAYPVVDQLEAVEEKQFGQLTIWQVVNIEDILAAAMEGALPETRVRVVGFATDKDKHEFYVGAPKTLRLGRHPTMMVKQAMHWHPDHRNRVGESRLWALHQYLIEQRQLLRDFPHVVERPPQYFSRWSGMAAIDLQPILAQFNQDDFRMSNYLVRFARQSDADRFREEIGPGYRTVEV